jgi:cysteinyl-tRNA synthetase
VLETGGSELLREVAEHRELFLDAMDDDFNTGGALGELFEVAHALNRFANEPGLEPGRARADRLQVYRAGMVVLRELSGLLGLFRRPAAAPAGAAGALTEGLLTEGLLSLLVDLRNRLRGEKNFAMADEVRNRLAELGVAIEDRPDGSKWRIEPRRGGATS